MGNRQAQVEDQVFQLRFASKQLSRESTRSIKEANKYRTKVKNALEANTPDIARTYAGTAVHHKATGLRFLELSARLEAAAARLQSSLMVGALGQSMDRLVRDLEAATATLDVDEVQANAACSSYSLRV